MQLQRYYNRPEKSWSDIAWKTLAPILSGKILAEYKYSNKQVAEFLALPNLVLNYYCAISGIELINIHIKNAQTEEFNSIKCVKMTDVISSYMYSLDGCVSSLSLHLMRDSGFFPYNIGRFLGLFSGAIHTIDKLFLPKVSEIEYSLSSSYYIEWVGEADEDGYCECVVKDSYGNIYEDISLV